MRRRLKRHQDEKYLSLTDHDNWSKPWMRCYWVLSFLFAFILPFGDCQQFIDRRRSEFEAQKKSLILRKICLTKCCCTKFDMSLIFLQWWVSVNENDFLQPYNFKYLLKLGTVVRISRNHPSYNGFFHESTKHISFSFFLTISFRLMYTLSDLAAHHSLAAVNFIEVLSSIILFQWFQFF